MANNENLKLIKTTEEAREKGRAGGIKSGEVRRKKKLLAQIYAELLAEKHEIDIDGIKQKVTGEALVKHVSKKIIMKGDSSSVSMLKEIREATEGSKTILSGDEEKPVFEIKVIRADK